ncbi:hypothetical protein [Paraburkholderia sp. GAS42]|jgi:hypothetical protein|uniref:hypothetical protein n=1 Tax=Paraburkholderia sp. GAS42 TaxID=3035135 RepID=UPI003D1EA3B9
MSTLIETSILSLVSLHRLVDDAAGQFAIASETLNDLGALFEAIIAATKGHELAHRLAALGARTAEEYRESFETKRDDYNRHSGNIVEAMQASRGERRRIHSIEDSSLEVV